MMIKNSKQHKITKTHLVKFTNALDSLKSQQENEGSSTLLSLQISALKSQMVDLQREIDEYEDLISGKIPITELNSIDELPIILIKARIALGLSQKQLGEMVKLPEQQIQRYESNEYESASLTRIKEIANALNLKINEHVTTLPDNFSLNKILRKMESFGIDTDFIMNKILPPTLASRFNDKDSVHDLLGLQASHYIGKVFGIKPESILNGTSLVLDNTSIPKVKYKIAKNTNKKKLHAHTLYARYIARLVLQAIKHKPIEKIPDEPFIVRKEILKNYGRITFDTILRYIWSLGIPVLVLDPISFHAACFKVKDQSIIILTQKTDHEARWMFNLLHEFYHASQGKEDIVESEEELRNSENEEERIASQFADYVLLGIDPHEITEKCLEMSNWNMPQIKKNIQKIAKEKNIRGDAWANYIAFRMNSEQGENFWQTSNALQKSAPNTRQMICDQLIENLDFSSLTESDLNLLSPILSIVTSKSSFPNQHY